MPLIGVLFAWLAFAGPVIQSENPDYHTLSYVPHHICVLLLGGEYAPRGAPRVGTSDSLMAGHYRLGGNGKDAVAAHVPECIRKP